MSRIIKIRASREIKAQKGLSSVKGNQCSHHSNVTYSHLLNKIHFIMFHCVKFSMTLTVCLKIIYSVSSFSMNSVVLFGEEYLYAIQYNFGLFYNHPPLCLEDFKVSTEESRRPISKILAAWYWNIRKRC